MYTNSKKIKILLFTIIVLSLFGIFDTTYLTAQFITGNSVACGITEGCDLVLSSDYSKIFGISLSAVGIAYYVTLLMLSLVFYSRNNKFSIILAAILSGVGVLFSIYLVYLQLFVIEAVCLYCMASAAFSAGIFILSFSICKSIKNQLD